MKGFGVRTRRKLAKMPATGLVVAALLSVSIVGAASQAYPDRPIRMIVPFAAGGGTDVVARIISQAVSAKVGASIVVENRPGASGALGAEMVARTASDGYTLMLTNQGPLTIVPFLDQKPPYNANSDFVPIALVGRQPALFVVNKSVAAHSLPDLISLAKANPGSLNFGSPGVGSDLHVIAELLNAEAGIKIQHVPFRGGAPALNALLGGQIQMMVVVYSTVKPHVEAGTGKSVV